MTPHHDYEHEQRARDAASSAISQARGDFRNEGEAANWIHDQHHEADEWARSIDAAIDSNQGRRNPSMRYDADGVTLAKWMCAFLVALAVGAVVFAVATQ